MILGVVALILVDRSVSSSVLTTTRLPNRSLTVLLPIVAALLAVTLFWLPARDLFGFAALAPVWLAGPPLASPPLLIVLELAKPI